MTKPQKVSKPSTSINQKTKNILQKKMALIWSALFLLSIGSIIVLFQLSASLKKHDRLDTTEQEITTLGYQLKTVSNYLTSEARSFAVTAAPSHLINYWNEVNIQKRREKALQKLMLVDTHKDTSRLLILSKHNSDELINTELRSMFLILSAYNIPIDLFPQGVRTYQPTPSETKLSGSKKILLAQKILFDKKYQDEKFSIMNPINEFNHKIIKNLKKSIFQVNREQANLLLILKITLSILALFIVCIAWYRLVE